MKQSLKKPKTLPKWGTMDSWNKLYMLTNLELPFKTIKIQWPHMSYKEREECCRYQRLTPEFIQAKWHEMSTLCRGLCLQNQILTPDLIDKIWRGSENEPSCSEITARSFSLIYQKLTPDFIKSKWAHMNTDQRTLCCRHQTLPPNCTLEHWNVMSKNEKLFCLRGGILQKLPIGYLPLLLVEDNVQIRETILGLIKNRKDIPETVVEYMVKDGVI